MENFAGLFKKRKTLKKQRTNEDVREEQIPKMSSPLNDDKAFALLLTEIIENPSKDIPRAIERWMCANPDEKFGTVKRRLTHTLEKLGNHDPYYKLKKYFEIYRLNTELSPGEIIKRTLEDEEINAIDLLYKIIREKGNNYDDVGNILLSDIIVKVESKNGIRKFLKLYERLKDEKRIDEILNGDLSAEYESADTEGEESEKKEEDESSDESDQELPERLPKGARLYKLRRIDAKPVTNEFSKFEDKGRLFEDSPWISIKRKVQLIQPLFEEGKNMYIIGPPQIDTPFLGPWFRPSALFFKLRGDTQMSATQEGDVLFTGGKRFKIMFLSNRENMIIQSEAEFRKERQYFNLRYGSSESKLKTLLRSRIQTLESDQLKSARRIGKDELLILGEDDATTIEHEIFEASSKQSLNDYFKRIASFSAYLCFDDSDERTVFSPKHFDESLTPVQKISSDDEALVRYFTTKEAELPMNMTNLLYSLLIGGRFIKTKISIPTKEAEEAFDTVKEINKVQELLINGHVDIENPIEVSPLRQPRVIKNILYYIDKTIDNILKDLASKNIDVHHKQQVCDFCKKHVSSDEFKSVRMSETGKSEIVVFCDTNCLENADFKED